ncbi:MAG: hypothetical protein ACI30B_09400 [Paludibacteraceae bacterium]
MSACFRGENGSICFYMVFFEGADMAQMADIIAAEKARKAVGTRRATSLQLNI